MSKERIFPVLMAYVTWYTNYVYSDGVPLAYYVGHYFCYGVANL